MSIFIIKKITKKSDENHLLEFKHHQREYAATPHLMFVKKRTSTTISGSNLALLSLMIELH